MSVRLTFRSVHRAAAVETLHRSPADQAAAMLQDHYVTEGTSGLVDSANGAGVNPDGSVTSELETNRCMHICKSCSHPWCFLQTMAQQL